MVNLNHDNLIEITENGDFFLLTTAEKIWLNYDFNVHLYGLGRFTDKDHIPAVRVANEGEPSKDGTLKYVVWRNGDIKQTIYDRIIEEDVIGLKGRIAKQK